MGTYFVYFVVLHALVWLSGPLDRVELTPILPLKPAQSNTIQHHGGRSKGSGVGTRGGGSASRGYASQMRPSPSDDLPILPLEYPEDNQTMPTQADLDTQQLKRLLGRHFDSEFMSSTRPLDSLLAPNGSLHYDFKNSHPRGKMPEELRQLSFSIPERRQRIRVKSPRRRKQLRQFLWSYTYCPVLFTWKNLGRRFWPRWIREGDCYNKGRSCSVPAGMTCKPQQSTTKTILWWHCRRKKCKWIKIQYPIITKCGCTC